MHPRHVQKKLTEALQDTPVVLLNGARQTGKSTLAKQHAKQDGMRYYTLDDATTLAAARQDPAGFIAGLTGPVVIDEVQRVPELFLAIKAAVDQHRTPGRFLLTGSANVLMLPTVADSLAGRMEVIELWPLSCAEMIDEPHFNRLDWLCQGDLNQPPALSSSSPSLLAKLLAGGFPEAAQRQGQRRAAWFDNYISAILQRDVRDLARIEQLTELPHMLALMAVRTGSLLNFSEVSRSLGLPQTTLKRYFALLETLFLLRRVPAWDRNAGKRLVKSPKVFVPDTGLAAHLAGLSDARLAAPTPAWGHLLETHVLTELIKHQAFSALGLTLWHYRTSTGSEVDFLMEDRAGRLTGVEVKASHTVGAGDFKGLRHLQETESDRFDRGVVLYAGDQIVPFAANLYAVPLSIWG
ncbi:MAG: ATP-binding protein [Pseudomonadota bacterium]